MIRRRAPFPRAELAAREVLAIRTIRTPEEIDLEAIIADHRITLRRDAIANAEGRLVRSGRRGVMTIDTSAFRSAKWRFVAAHELGHFLLHEYAEKLACFPKRDATREEKSRSFLDETAASNFGVELILPTEQVLPRCDRAASPLERARSLSSAFGVSLPTAALRTLDFTDEPCAVAYSERGVVSWCTATPAFGVNVPNESRVPDGAGAPTPRAVPARTWGRSGGRVDHVHEASVKLDPFDAIVTMLWHAPIAGA
jgi:Zn-dependent peptidase ImmA (M78 family)